ncbi:hypothetical protein LCGC14_0382090 [marine sediment metagenome]|uniref:Uncharacterized protein n=1 Tax=marine sediment metagenome TaxID=412755 RepID=A0A0F9T1N2_9ZZZZ
MLSAREIDELAEHQRRTFSHQRDDDIFDKDIIRQRHIIDAQKDKKLQVRPVGTGYGKLVTAQNRSYLSAAPFIAYTAPRDTLKAYAEELEAATQEIWKLSGAWLAWLRSIRDVVDVGRGWLLIHSLPKLWKGLDFQQGEEESDKEFTDRLNELKLDNFPVIAQHVDVRDTWPTFTLKRELDQVVELREMTARQLEAAYNSRFGLDKDTDRAKVIVYADHTHMRTVIAKHGGIAGFGSTPAQEALEPWEHGMKMNPYVLMEAPPLSENDEGVVWEGSVAALRHLIPEMDGALTDIRHSGRKSARAQRVFKLNLTDRRQDSPNAKSNADLITITPEGDIVLNLDEGIDLLGAAQANPDNTGFLGIARSFTQENAIRPSLLGLSENASESGIEFNTKSQIAQNDFGPAIDFLSDAAENVARHFIAGLISFSETFKDIGLEDDKIPLSFVNSKGISQKTDLKASDLKGWDKRLQAKIEAQIPVNRNQQIVTARLAADPVSGIMSLETAMELYTPIANPLEEMRKRDLDKIRAALVNQRVQAAEQVAFQIASAPANSDILAQDFAALPESQKRAVQMAAQTQGQTVPEARGEANTAREGMTQVAGIPNA